MKVFLSKINKLISINDKLQLLKVLFDNNAVSIDNEIYFIINDRAYKCSKANGNEIQELSSNALLVKITSSNVLNIDCVYNFTTDDVNVDEISNVWFKNVGTAVDIDDNTLISILLKDGTIINNTTPNMCDWELTGDDSDIDYYLIIGDIKFKINRNRFNMNQHVYTAPVSLGTDDVVVEQELDVHEESRKEYSNVFTIYTKNGDRQVLTDGDTIQEALIKTGYVGEKAQNIQWFSRELSKTDYWDEETQQWHKLQDCFLPLTFVLDNINNKDFMVKNLELQILKSKFISINCDVNGQLVIENVITKIPDNVFNPRLFKDYEFIEVRYINDNGESINPERFPSSLTKEAIATFIDRLLGNPMNKSSNLSYSIQDIVDYQYYNKAIEL